MEQGKIHADRDVFEMLLALEAFQFPAKLFILLDSSKKVDFRTQPSCRLTGVPYGSPCATAEPPLTA